MADGHEIDRVLENVGFLVTYSPLRTEVDGPSFVSRNIPAYLIPPRPALDPFLEAGKAEAAADGKTATVLIPGRKFDPTGTRYGQGGGWYDRFLSKVPPEWVRIGFCFDDQFSDTTLLRNEWDQQMDYIVVVARDGGTLTLHASPRGT